ncbi:bifunctional 23S rRNA (guanine(2069)-N(7))-methyltransferase RlmK/23S rRNA (guanine(2445)-N(2))-methyltransferase RlmL [Parahaliea mediterranea]|uniref:Ribosomal RNA large subunit methyltransferase K/L n=1 Tax=Parahaliea mediterranea TaxID=651086 RepID=A0A939DJM1_9GAMM|nr:bifunctional 23S rRNA (guanine(2069)-N(7))-methyltransferase RlmK/23S rRNA (guanine(2445)-N(2))-methyltransferase RlmL [Parahaliea mediterranea]
MSSAATRDWFATCPKGIESLLAHELETLGAVGTRETVAGVYFSGPLAVAYRACLWSRLANRVLLPIASVDADTADALYQGLGEIAWLDWLDVRQTFAIDFSGQNRAIRNTQFGAQRSKDAIVDWFQNSLGRRPSVARRDPDLRFNVRLSRDRAMVALDMAGGSLHRRGYRTGAGAAPLKENLAAALLLRADWPGMAARGGALIDPMCGSGTLLLEGAMMAADVAPGLERGRYGFEAWRGHNPEQWRAILGDARGRAERGRARQLPEMRGYDADHRVVRRAQENIARLGLERSVRVTCKPLGELRRPTHVALPEGLLICNPPYGERLGEKESLRYLYRELGEVMKREFGDWQAAIFTADVELGRAIGLRSHRQYKLYNGAIPSTLLLFELRDNRLRDAGGAGEASARPEPSAPLRQVENAPDPAPLSEGAQMFANRLRKNRKRLASWVRREAIECYRVYDADMPEYAVAVDLYGERVHVAEYQAPRGVDPEAAARRMDEVLAALPTVFEVAPGDIACKLRQRQRGAQQYQRREARGELISVREGAARLLVNLHDYLDTGLFLDHRPLRRRIAAESAGADFLNLFCYTGAATVHAALGGARSTTSVDLSNTYLGWLRKNLAHNGLGESAHRVERADCLAWLGQTGPSYDLIMLDPPSFSNSRAMADSFDVQRDHLALVRAAMARLRPEGQLYFSNNRRGFKLDPLLAEAFDCEDITAATLDPDFARNPRVHVCYRLRHRDGGSRSATPWGRG